MVVVGTFGLVMVPVPLMMDQLPVALPTGVLPVTVTWGLFEQTLWSAPALAGCALPSNRLIVTWSVVGAPHGPLFTLHWKTFVPTPRPVIEVDEDPGAVIVPAPLTNVHVPVAGKITLLPAIFTVVTGVHVFWSGPAFAVGLFASYTRTTTWSVEVPHEPLFTAHWKTFCPTGRLVIDVKGEFTAVIVPPPLITDHWPVATPTGGLAPIDTLVVVEQMLWSAPALAVGALLLKTLIVTSSTVVPFAHGPLLTVQRNTFAPTPSPVIVVVGEPGVVMVPAPLMVVQAPVAGKINELPAMVAVVVGVQRFWSGPAFATGLFAS